MWLQCPHPHPAAWQLTCWLATDSQQPWAANLQIAACLSAQHGPCHSQPVLSKGWAGSAHSSVKISDRFWSYCSTLVIAKGWDLILCAVPENSVGHFWKVSITNHVIQTDGHWYIHRWHNSGVSLFLPPSTFGFFTPSMSFIITFPLMVQDLSAPLYAASPVCKPIIWGYK